MHNVGIVGYGYWGPNIVRNFQKNKKSKVTSVCDLDDKALKSLIEEYPSIEVTKDYREVTRCPNVDIVGVVTPVSTHYAIAKDALLNGKHIFVEKPFTKNSDQAKELLDLAAQKNLMIMVDHTFLFTDAVMQIKNMIDEQVLGKVCYYDSTRVNLGLFQNDVNVIWDLAPHDFSIMNYIIKEEPKEIAVHAMDHFNRGLENTAYITIYFDNMISHINLNWLSPVKIRQTLIGGEKKMIVWDDIKPDEKIKIYNKGISMGNSLEKNKILVDYRLGEVVTPQLKSREALAEELDHFLDCLETGTVPINDGLAGLRVVQMLEASDQSMRNAGKVVKL